MPPLPPAASILDVLGNTPVVKLQHVVPEDCADVYVKLEYFSATGSYKDRMAKSMIEEAERSGRLAPHMTVVEATGGSTGSSLAFLCAVKGYPFVALSSNAYANEKLLTMAAFGAKVDITHSPTGKATADLMMAMKSKAANLRKGDDCFYTDQFSNGDALVGYREIGHELIAQFPDGFDGFCGSFGTGGMVMGVSSVLKPVMPDIRVVLVEPEGSALLAKGQKGAHGVDGISPGFISQHVDKALYDGTQTINEEEGRDMCRRLAKCEGRFVGTSSGLNIAAAVHLAKQLGTGKKVVTVACDTGLKYLTGSLFSE
ncbi:cysteine synthase [Fusarium subglutinans]|uniref:Cysteine synthase n=1 Tax=Gibberella subglutinans TaxID=42677 RepID=A0A8H5V0E3_GIBSU|nr:cysteine synthase [Fusarium subglutinans]KAF5603829.1 cysteine synthase [Fusarium subglutinans]